MSKYLQDMRSMVGLSILSRAFGMLTTIALARILGASNFGIYSIVVNTANSAYSLIRLGIDAAVHVHTAESHETNKEKEEKGILLAAGFLLLSCAGLIGGGFCLIGAPWIAETIYGDVGLAYWVRFAGVLVVIQCVSQFAYTVFAGLENFRFYSKIIVIFSGIGLIITLISSLIFDLIGAVASLLITQALIVFVLLPKCLAMLRESEIVLRIEAFGRMANKIFRTGFYFYVSGLISVPIIYYVQGILVRYCGLDSLGQLRVVVSICTIVSLVPTSISAVMISHLAKHKIEEGLKFANKIDQNIKLVWGFSLLLSTLLFFAFPLLVKLLFGESYMDATIPGALALCGVVLTCVLGVLNNLLLSIKRTGLMLVGSIAQVTIFLVFSYALIPDYGLIGYFTAEALGLVGAIFVAIQITFEFKKNINYCKNWWVSMVALSLINFGVFVSPVFASYEISIIFAVPIFIISIFWFVFIVLNESERSVFQKILKNKF